MKKFKLNIFPISIFIVENREETKKIMYKIDKEYNLDNFDNWGGCCINNGGYIYICLFDKDIKTICHEIYHATKRITEYVNVEDEETEAYVNGYISERVFKELNIKI